MPEILLCNQFTDTNTIKNQFGIDPSELIGLNNNQNISVLKPYHPYLHNRNPSARDHQTLKMLGTPSEVENLTTSSLTFGGEKTLGLAHIAEKLKEDSKEMAGASIELYNKRADKFVDAVREYQKALLAYRKVYKTNPTSRMLAKQKVLRAFEAMQSKFQHELKAVSYASKAKRGIALTNPTRAMNIARSSRNVAKLHIADQIEASKLVRYAKYTKFIGNGLAVLDFGERIGKIHDSYKEGGNWEKEMFIESSSFIAGAGTSSVVLDAGAAVLGFLMVATPIGWVGLIIGGVVVAGSAAAAGIVAGSEAHQYSGSLYDKIMKAVE